MKRVIVTVVASGLLVLGSAGVAAAQTGGTTSPSTPATGAHHDRGHHRHELLAVAARALGVSREDLRKGLCSGKTLAQLASEHGKSSQDLVHALVQAADARIDRAVQAGRLDAAQAAQRKGQVEARVTQLVNRSRASSERCERRSGGSATTPTSTS